MTQARPPTEGRLERLSLKLVPWLISRRRSVLLSALLLSIVGGVGSVLLYSDLRSGLEELLPENAPSVVAARKVGPKMRAADRLAIVLDGANPDAIERFADDLAVRLRALPKDLIDQVEYRTDEQDAFIRQFGLLYLDKADLQSVHDRIDARVTWERDHTPGLMLFDDEAPAPSVDFSDIRQKYGVMLNNVVEFRKGYYQTPEGNQLVLLLRPPEVSTGLEFHKRMLDAVQHEVNALNPTKYDAHLRVGYSGDVTEIVEEQLALVKDLTASTVIVFVLVIGALWLYYRRWGAIAAVLGPLAVGCAVTFGLGYVMIGHLNANTAFLGSIVLGNGINAGIIFVARYIEERHRERSVEDAIRVTWARTLPATFVASFGAALSYLSLAVTDFRGFSQFGLIGFVGMTLCWLGVYLLGPALLAAIEGWRPIDPGRAAKAGEGLGRLTGWVERTPFAFRLAGIVLIAACGLAIANYRGELVEYDMTHIRSKASLQSGAVYWSKVMDNVFRAYLTPIVIWAETPENLDKVVDRLNERRKALGDQDPIREVRTFQGAIPTNQAEKLPIIADIRRMLPPSRLKKLDPKLRADLSKLLPTQPPRIMTERDLPDVFQRALIEKDGTKGRIALVFPKKVGTLDMRDAHFFKGILRGAIDDAGVKAYALASLLLISDLDDAIWHDGPKATLIAFVLVCCLVVLVLRRPGPTLMVISALLVGLLGLIGLAAAAQTRVNFLNFVVLAITFGIGVDYAINIVQRYRTEGVASLGRILQETGSAVALCSATTVIGYGSLMVADSQALSGFGLLAAIGEVTCLSTALFLLPAWLFPRKPTPKVEVAPRPERVVATSRG